MGYLIISSDILPTDGQIIDMPVTATYVDRLPTDPYGHKLVIPCAIVEAGGQLRARMSVEPDTGFGTEHPHGPPS